MMQLAENFGAVSMQARNHSGKRFDVAVACHGQLAWQTCAVMFIDARDACNQQAQSVFRPAFIIVDQLLRGRTVKIGHAHFQGRQNHSVAQGHLANPSF